MQLFGQSTPSQKNSIKNSRSSSTLLWLLVIVASLTVLAPLFALLSRSFYNRNNAFVGFDNVITYIQTPQLLNALYNTLHIGLVVALITVSLAFIVAYTLQRTAMPGRSMIKMIALLPILAPSMLPAIALIYLFGNQGLLKSLIGDSSIYGKGGMVTGLVFWCFPHALLLILTGLRRIDGRLYEAARSMRASPLTIFMTVTLPNARYGIISAFVTVFTLSICDFGVPKIIGGNTGVLATDIYKLAIGQLDFGLSAVAAITLLIPALLTFSVDAWLKRHSPAMTHSQATHAPVNRLSAFQILAAVISCLAITAILVIISTAVFASFVNFWPFNMALTFKHYQFANISSYGYAPFLNSLQLGLLTAALGTVIVFSSAYLTERSQGATGLKNLLKGLVMLPLAIPGLVLGIGYIMFFSAAVNPAHALYGSMTLLVICTVVHLYTVPHLMCVTGLKQLPTEIEAAAASLKIPKLALIRTVVLPMLAPVLLDVFTYLFVNAMTTTSAVIFIYSSGNIPASVAVLHLDEAGYMPSAAAMSVLIMLTACVVKLSGTLLSARLRKNQVASS